MPLEFEQTLQVKIAARLGHDERRGPGLPDVLSAARLAVRRASAGGDPVCGESPSYVHSRQALDAAGKPVGEKPAVKESEGRFLGKGQRWFAWTSGSGAQVRQNAEGVGEGGQRLLVHVYYSAATEAEMKDLEKIVQAMKIVEGTKPAAPAKAEK